MPRRCRRSSDVRSIDVSLRLVFLLGTLRYSS